MEDHGYGILEDTAWKIMFSETTKMDCMEPDLYCESFESEACNSKPAMYDAVARNYSDS